MRRALSEDAEAFFFPLLRPPRPFFTREGIPSSRPTTRRPPTTCAHRGVTTASRHNGVALGQSLAQSLGHTHTHSHCVPDTDTHSRHTLSD